jgi:hypothetical protein
MQLEDFCQIIENTFSQSKYKKWYINLVKKTLDRVNFEKPNHKKQACFNFLHIERHHICPIAIFPEYSKEKQNLAYITPKEHFVAHLLLLKMCRIDNKWVIPMAHALTMMKRCNKDQKRIFNSNEYSFIRFAASLARKGVPRSNEMKLKLSKARKGKYIGKENGMYGVKHKKESIINMSVNSIKPHVKNLTYELTKDTWNQFVNEVIDYSIKNKNCSKAARFYNLNAITVRAFFKRKKLPSPNGYKGRIMPKRKKDKFDISKKDLE